MNNFDILASYVSKAGQFAKKQQGRIHPTLKSDGSVLTETDLAVTEQLTSAIKELFPNCNIVTEETDRFSYNPEAEYTFVLDPIDGTNSYSQGLPSWCIALGILDKNRNAVGSMICAPRFGISCEELFIRTDPGDDRIFLNGEVFTPFEEKTELKQLCIGSNTIKQMDISPYKGKIRAYGSSIIHLVAPVVFAGISGCINQTCYVWDIAAAHAIMLKANMDICFIDGTPFSYTDELAIERKSTKLSTFSGSKIIREKLLELLGTQNK